MARPNVSTMHFSGWNDVIRVPITIQRHLSNILLVKYAVLQLISDRTPTWLLARRNSNWITTASNQYPHQTCIWSINCVIPNPAKLNIAQPKATQTVIISVKNFQRLQFLFLKSYVGKPRKNLIELKIVSPQRKTTLNHDQPQVSTEQSSITNYLIHGSSSWFIAFTVIFALVTGPDFVNRVIHNSTVGLQRYEHLGKLGVRNCEMFISLKFHTVISMIT